MTGKAMLVEMLEAIRDQATNGLYSQALLELDRFLMDYPDDIQALRLKGNVLELRALDYAQYRAEKLLRSRDYVSARECYEKILGIDPRNTLALVDLGDHYKNLDAYDRALDYYLQAIRILETGECRLEWQEEVEDILDKAADLSIKVPPNKLAGFDAICRRLLEKTGSD